MTNWIYDNGTWTACTDQKQIWVESTDFLHDVRLYVNGDFEDSIENFDYANEIAKRLNQTTAPRELSDKDIIKIMSKVKCNQWTTPREYAFEVVKAILKKASEK